MIGQTIDSRPMVPWGVLTLLALAAGCIMLAILQQSSGWLIFAVLPGFLAAALFLSRPGHFTAEFTPSSMEVLAPVQLSIPYASIEGLVAPGRPYEVHRHGPHDYPIQVCHADGLLEIPAGLTVPADAVYCFLYSTLSPSGDRAVNPLLSDYVNRQEQVFGVSKVFTYRARHHFRPMRITDRSRHAVLAIGLACLTWFVIGIVGGGRGEAVNTWICISSLFGVIAGMFWLLLLNDLQRGPRGIKDWRHASLAISPVGLALLQGDQKGEMRWDEAAPGCLSDRFGFRDHSRRGLLLHLEGATILLQDIFDRPLPVIHQRIQEYWKRTA